MPRAQRSQFLVSDDQLPDLLNRFGTVNSGRAVHAVASPVGL